MKTASYYLLLSSIASTALAACGDEGGSAESDECPHDVLVKSENGTVRAADACRAITPIAGQVGASYGISPQRCAALCRDPAMNRCDLPADYMRAFETTNGPADALDGAAAVDLVCPARAEAELMIVCSHHEIKGTKVEGCPVAGRRPQGLVLARQCAQRQVADYLARSAHLEAASVLAFEELAQDLSRLGAPPRLVADCLRAARQELEHARSVRALARARGAEPAKVHVRARTLPSLLELALQNAVEGVVRESYGALQAIVSARGATAHDVRPVMDGIAADEAEHAALSLRIAAWLETRLSADERMQVARARRAAIAELRRELDHDPDPTLRAELGIPARTLATRLVDELAAHLEGTTARAAALA